MKNKLKFLIKDSFNKKVGTKWFKIINIILLLVIVALLNIDIIVKKVGGDFNNLTEIYIVDNANIYDDFKQLVDNSYLTILENYNSEIKKSDKTLDELKKDIKENKKDDIIINITSSNNIFDAEIISYEYIDTILYQNIVNALNTIKSDMALKESNISNDDLNNIYKEVLINRVVLNETLDSNEEQMDLIGGILVAVFIVPFFFLILIIVQMIGAEINEEKSSKSMEIIISSVPPKIHFMSKLIAANLFAVVQGALLILYLVIGAVVKFLTTNISILSGVASNSEISNYLNEFMSSEVFTTIVKGIPFFIIILLLSFFAYSLLTGILASMTTNMEDYQQLQIPITIFLMVGYYLALIAASYKGAIFIKVAAFIPFISGILAPVLYTLGQMSLIELGISISILAITCYLLYKYGLKVYKVGILNYSSNKLWKKIFKSLKE